jgi:hypothetical protein
MGTDSLNHNYFRNEGIFLWASCTQDETVEMEASVSEIAKGLYLE